MFSLILRRHQLEAKLQKVVPLQSNYGFDQRGGDWFKEFKG